MVDTIKTAKEYDGPFASLSPPPNEVTNLDTAWEKVGGFGKF